MKVKRDTAMNKGNSLLFMLSQYLISQRSFSLRQISLCYESDTSSFLNKCYKMLVCISKYQ